MESKTMTGISITSIALAAICVSLVACAPINWSGKGYLNVSESDTQPVLNEDYSSQNDLGNAENKTLIVGYLKHKSINESENSERSKLEEDANGIFGKDDSYALQNKKEVDNTTISNQTSSQEGSESDFTPENDSQLTDPREHGGLFVWEDESKKEADLERFQPATNGYETTPSRHTGTLDHQGTSAEGSTVTEPHVSPEPSETDGAVKDPNLRLPGVSEPPKQTLSLDENSWEGAKKSGEFNDQHTELQKDTHSTKETASVEKILDLGSKQADEAKNPQIEVNKDSNSTNQSLSKGQHDGVSSKELAADQALSTELLREVSKVTDDPRSGVKGEGLAIDGADRHQSEIIDEDYGVSNFGTHEMDSTGNSVDQLSVTSESSSETDTMTLSDDVIIDALFANLDVLQDNIEMCEEGLRQKLSLIPSGDLYTSEEASRIISVDDDEDGIEDDSDDDMGHNNGEGTQGGGVPLDELNSKDDDTDDNSKDEEKAGDDSDGGVDDDDEDDDDEDDDDEDDGITEGDDDDEIDVNNEESVDGDNDGDSENHPDLHDHSESHVPNEAASPSEKQHSTKHITVPSSTSVPNSLENVQTRQNSQRKARRRRSVEGSPQNSASRQRSDKGHNLKYSSNSSTKSIHNKASHEVVLRLSNRLHYLKQSLEECYLLYKQFDDGQE